MATIQDRVATIHTAGVEIRVLKVEGKQVTLAVFRQLPRRYLIDEATVQLRGVPWGRVNYHPDSDCSPTLRHVHVVWQDGDELFRASIREQVSCPDSWPGSFDEFRERWAALYAGLLALDQLFIAV